MRPSRGQASVEYVAIVALVGGVLLAAVALTTGGLGAGIADAIERGLCTVTGSACPPPRRVAADLPPCPLSRDTRGQSLDVNVVLVHLGQGLSLLRETYSDGHVEIQFADEQSAGLAGTLGAGFRIGRPGGKGVEAGVSGTVDVAFTAGRRWRFPGARAADAFVRRYGHLQTLGGRLVDDAKRDCFFCHWVGALEPDRPPPPDADFEQLGGRVSLTGAVGAGGHGLGARAGLTGALGVRHDRDGGRTIYFRAGGRAAALLFLRTGAGRAASAEATIGVTLDRAGRPTGLALQGAAAGLDLSGRRRLGGTRAGETGLVHELELDVPLGSTAARALLAGVLRGLTPGGAASLPDAVAAAAAWGAAHAEVTRRTYALTSRQGGLEVQGKLGGRLGAGVGTEARGLRLLDVETRLPGLPFRTRADCVAT